MLQSVFEYLFPNSFSKIYLLFLYGSNILVICDILPWANSTNLMKSNILNWPVTKIVEADSFSDPAILFHQQKRADDRQDIIIT